MKIKPKYIFFKCNIKIEAANVEIFFLIKFEISSGRMDQKSVAVNKQKKQNLLAIRKKSVILHINLYILSYSHQSIGFNITKNEWNQKKTFLHLTPALKWDRVRDILKQTKLNK